jgi:hypothetical protein
MPFAQYTKGMIVPIDSVGQIVVFEWNPYELHNKKTVKWKGIHTAGREQPLYQYGCGEAQVISVSIEVSRWNNSDFFVQGFFDSLLELTKPLVQGAGVNRPPRVQLILGASINMTCFIDDVHVRYGSHRGQMHHYTYLATSDLLLPKEGHVIIKFKEYK